MAFFGAIYKINPTQAHAYRLFSLWNWSAGIVHVKANGREPGLTSSEWVSLERGEIVWAQTHLDGWLAGVGVGACATQTVSGADGGHCS